MPAAPSATEAAADTDAAAEAALPVDAETEAPVDAVADDVEAAVPNMDETAEQTEE